MPTAHEVRARSAQLYDDIRERGGIDFATQAEFDFLDAVERIEDEWHRTVLDANLQWGGGSLAWESVKFLATRKRDAELVAALKTLEATDDLAFTQEAAE